MTMAVIYTIALTTLDVKATISWSRPVDSLKKSNLDNTWYRQDMQLQSPSWPPHGDYVVISIPLGHFWPCAKVSFHGVKSWVTENRFVIDTSIRYQDFLLKNNCQSFWLFRVKNNIDLIETCSNLLTSYLTKSMSLNPEFPTLMRLYFVLGDIK